MAGHRRTSKGKRIPRGAIKTDGFIKPRTKAELAKLRMRRKARSM